MVSSDDQCPVSSVDKPLRGVCGQSIALCVSSGLLGSGQSGHSVRQLSCRFCDMCDSKLRCSRVGRWGGGGERSMRHEGT